MFDSGVGLVKSSGVVGMEDGCRELQRRKVKGRGRLRRPRPYPVSRWGQGIASITRFNSSSVLPVISTVFSRPLAPRMMLIDRIFTSKNSAR